MADKKQKHNHAHCDCRCHADRVEYRLVAGTSFEGVSIRDIYYDKNNRIIGWGRFPLSFLGATAKDVAKDLVNAMQHIDDMLEATKKPILDEAKLEAHLENGLIYE